MANHLIVTRTNENGSLLLKKIFDCPFSIEIVRQLLFIEKNKWKSYYNPPYYGLGRYIFYHLEEYPQLVPLITPYTTNFDFTYQYLLEHSFPISIEYSLNNMPLPEDEYMKYAYHQYYLERWMIIEPISYSMLVIFECENNPIKNKEP